MIPAAAYWLLDAGYLVLDTGCRMPDAGCRMPVFGLENLNSRNCDIEHRVSRNQQPVTDVMSVHTAPWFPHPLPQFDRGLPPV